MAARKRSQPRDRRGRFTKPQPPVLLSPAMLERLLFYYVPFRHSEPANVLELPQPMEWVDSQEV